MLLSCLSPDRNWVVQTAAGDFIKAIITISANASQNEQQCIGPNELTRQLVSRDCVKRLIGYMLAGGNPLTVGVGIVIEVIRKNNSDYDPDVGADEGSVPSSRDPIYLGTLLRLFADHVPDFMKLIMNAPTSKKDTNSTFGGKVEPLGFDRFKTCELMAELLHCSNMGLMNEVGSEELIVARDAERHRLRNAGKLVPRRGDEDVSMTVDDPSMHFSAPSEDPRRLEVTNVAEDDGFEEVEHSREMNEDTSHEFIKAEDEMLPPVPTSSFFDKDEDDLMDEPLSSPRLHLQDKELGASDFEDLDLVVAPLSPKKGGNASAVSEAAATVPVVPDAPVMEDVSHDVSSAAETPMDTAAADTSAPEAPVKEVDESLGSSTAQPESTEEPMSGEPDDKPSAPEPAETDPTVSQPEQSAPPYKEDSTVPHLPELSTDVIPAAQDEESTQAASEATPEMSVVMDDDRPPPAVPAPPQLAASVVPPAADAPEPSSQVDGQEGDDGDATIEVESIVIQAAPDPPTTETANPPARPVVGDYLKVQLVEHRVVPAILVCAYM
jgi:SIT4-associating protein SAP185/190